MPDYDFYHGLYSGQQVDSAVARALVGGQLDQDIAAIRAAVGSPLVANTAAEMTNISKIYVYTGSEAGYTSGNWYYYENGSWHDGGLYNSAAVDTAMSDSSMNAVANKIIKAYVDGAVSKATSEMTDEMFLLSDEVPDTVQTYVFVDGAVSQVLHDRNGTVIRTDDFAYTPNSITETRTLNTGAVLVIVTDLETLETTVNYTAA